MGDKASPFNAVVFALATYFTTGDETAERSWLGQRWLCSLALGAFTPRSMGRLRQHS
jgi:hypothetical protein